jgi:hypothetical protein
MVGAEMLAGREAAVPAPLTGEMEPSPCDASALASPPVGAVVGAAARLGGGPSGNGGLCSRTRGGVTARSMTKQVSGKVPASARCNDS